MWRVTRFPRLVWDLSGIFLSMAREKARSVASLLGYQYLVALTIGVGTTWVFTHGKPLDTDFFGVAAQIIPVIGLAYLVEARAIINQIIKGRIAAKNIHDLLIEGHDDYLRQKAEIESSNTDLKLADISKEDLADIVRRRSAFGEIIDKMKRSSRQIFFIGGTAEAVALTCFAFDWTSPIALGFVLTNILISGLLLVRLTRPALSVMELTPENIMAKR